MVTGKSCQGPVRVSVTGDTLMGLIVPGHGCIAPSRLTDLLLVALATTAVLIGMLPASATAQAQQISHGRAVAARTFTGNLRELPLVEEFLPGRSVMEGPKRRLYPRGTGPLNWTTLDQPDPLLHLQRSVSEALQYRGSSRAFSAPLLNTDGLGNSFVLPPDTVGDVGPTYYIQMTNGSGGTPFLVINKSTGATVAGPTSLHSLWP
ncbi:MAG TPA: hypothetical protein EYG16_04460, partial [Deltaproteobacteria bacterium]|nr:hypothetical protein [Deltaproteobacteria bacterium]